MNKNEKELKIKFEGNQIAKINLDITQKLTKIRQLLSDIISFPFLFEDSDEKEISKKSEGDIILEDILDGKNIYIKKEIIPRKVLGNIIDNRNGLDIYEYPLIKLTEKEMQSSTNILVVGETGHGKSTWINALINYLQGIQLEEKIRYNLFNEKKMQEDYQKKNGKKVEGASVTDFPNVYNIDPGSLYTNPIRIVDTAGYGDTRNDAKNSFDEKITSDIKEFLESSTINTINAICLIMKAQENRLHRRIIYVLEKLFYLFGNDVMRNIIIIFTHASSGEIKALEVLNSSNSPFRKYLGSVDQYKYFAFDSKVYFTEINSDNKIYLEAQYKNVVKNFSQFFSYIFGLQSISLESTKRVIRDRMHIKNNILNLTSSLSETMVKIKSSVYNENVLMNLKNDLKEKENSPIPLEEYEDTITESEVIDETFSCEQGWYVLYCDTCKKVCHNKCKGAKEGWHSSTYGCDMISTFGSKCSECNCLDTAHSFKNNYTIKKEVKKDKKIIKYRENKDAINKKEEVIKKIKADVENLEVKLKFLNAEITSSLMDAINLTFQLALKDDELNTIALKKDKKYGFTQKVIEENISKENKTEAFTEIMNSLPDIENICSDQESKKRKVEEIRAKIKRTNSDN